MEAPFRYGTLPANCPIQKRDASGVVSRDLIALLREVGLPDTLKEFSLCSGVSVRILSRIFGSTNMPPVQPWTALLTADRLLTALDAGHRIHELTFIPNTELSDARVMAQYEFVDSDGDEEVLIGTREQIEVRAMELMALRQALIGDELRALAPRKAVESKSRAARKKRSALQAA